MRRLFLIRHGETVWNAEGRFTTHSDVPLSHRGIAQAHAVADALAETPLDRIYASPMERAEMTAGIIADRQEGGCPVAIDPRLAEISAGPFDGYTSSELEAGSMARAFQRWHTDGEPEFPPGTETFDDALARVQAFFAEHEDEPGATAIVTHGSLARLIVCSHVLGGPPPRHRRLWLDNGHMAELQERDGVMKMVAFNAAAPAT